MTARASVQVMSALQRLATPSRADTAQGLALRLVKDDRPTHAFATVMFVDVKSSMTLSRTVEPEEWWSVIDGLFELMSECVYRFGGWVGNFTGDGIKAVFEDTAGTDGHARRACQSALCLRDSIESAAEELYESHRLKLSVRIGINSGDVLTGTIGERSTGYYTAIGYPVGLAKRIEGLASPDRILLSEHTASLVSELAELRDLGTFDVKGSELPVGVFELIGEHAVAGHYAR
jgi:class 3 adenylate cyclase